MPSRTAAPRSSETTDWQNPGAASFIAPAFYEFASGGLMSQCIVWRHATTGENYLYPMNGTTIKPTEGYLRTVSNGRWTVTSR